MQALYLFVSSLHENREAASPEAKRNVALRFAELIVALRRNVLGAVVSAGGVAEEGPVARDYQRAGGSSVQVWEVPGVAHTGGLRKHPAEYERRTMGFLDEALGI